MAGMGAKRKVRISAMGWLLSMTGRSHLGTHSSSTNPRKKAPSYTGAQLQVGGGKVAGMWAEGLG